MKYLIYFLISSLCFAVTDKDLWDSEIEPESYSEKRINEYKETLLQDEALVSQIDSDTGVEGISYFTGEDQHKLTLSLHTGIRPSRMSGHQQFDFTYAYRFQRFWLEGFVSSISTTFENIAENPRGTSSNADSEYNFSRTDDETENLLVYGLGTSYRFDMPFEYLKERQFFHTVGAYLTYNSLDEGLRGQTYVGPGLKAALNVHKRASKFFHYGLNFTYNLASVKRDAVFEEEPNNDRRLNLAWYTFGFEIGLYF